MTHRFRKVPFFQSGVRSKDRRAAAERASLRSCRLAVDLFYNVLILCYINHTAYPTIGCLFTKNPHVIHHAIELIATRGWTLQAYGWHTLP